MIKHAIDITVALAGVAVLSVPLALIAAAIKLDSRGPVFFRQERVGRGGRCFGIMKFRTMVPGAVDLEGGVTTWRGDPRVTRVGRVLRDWGLDEIPQLFNVLRGEMSLVGPRPALPDQVAQYTSRQRRRLDMRPGMTSLPVVVARNRLPWSRKIELDIRYIEEWSLWLDLRILVKTAWVVLSTQEGSFKSDFEPEREDD